MPPIVVLLSGPNLELLGQRQPEIYGTATLADHVAGNAPRPAALGLELEHFQSDAEVDLVTAVHGARGRVAAIIVNAGAVTHYGWSLHDAIASFEGPVVELHLSNPDAREPWRHRSVLSPVVDGTIAGFGGLGYELAVEAVAAAPRALALPPPAAALSIGRDAPRYRSTPSPHPGRRRLGFASASYSPRRAVMALLGHQAREHPLSDRIHRICRDARRDAVGDAAHHRRPLSRSGR